MLRQNTDEIRKIGYKILQSKRDTKNFNLKENEIIEWKRCRENPLYYIHKYVKFEIIGGISSYSEGKNFHPKLRRVVRVIYKHHKCQLMATRQLGKSTISGGLISWANNFYFRNNAIILNLRKDAALKNLKTIKFINDELPPFLRVDLTSKSDIKTYAEFANGSIITVYYPTTVHTKSTIARSLTSPILYVDEAAHIPDMGEIFGSAQQILSKAREQARKNNYPYFILITTTPNGIEGTGEWFYNRWSNGVESDILFDTNDDNPLIEKWIDDPDPILNDPSKNGFVKVKYHWTEDPTKNDEWYREQCRELSDQRKINQELDLAFVGSSNCIFDDDLLAKFKGSKSIETVNCPYETNLVVYEKDLNPNDYYIIGVDTARSLSGAYNSIEIFSFANFQQIAEFNYRLGSFTKYGEVIDFVFRWLFKQVQHNIIIAIENNTIGLAPIEYLLNIKDIFYSQYIYRESNKKEWGISTTGISKDLMIGCLTEILKENPTVIKSQDLINQMSAIERSRGGNISSDTFSDLFMAASFCAYVRKMKALEIMPLIKLGVETVQNTIFDTYKSFLEVKEKPSMIDDDLPQLYSESELEAITKIESQKLRNEKDIIDISGFFSPFFE